MIEISETIRKNYKTALYDEIRFFIINALEFYKSVNLKRLAILVDRPETTTIRYIKKLLEEELIVIDEVRTAKDWGKFYKLSKPVLALIEEHKKLQAEREDLVSGEIGDYKNRTNEELDNFFVKSVLSKKDIEHDFKMAKQSLDFSINVQKLIVNEGLFAITEMLTLIKDKGVDYLKENLIIHPSDLEMWNSAIKLTSVKQLIELIEVFFGWQKEINDLKQKFEKEMEDEKVPEEQKRDFFMSAFFGSFDFAYELKDKKK